MRAQATHKHTHIVTHSEAVEIVFNYVYFGSPLLLSANINFDRHRRTDSKEKKACRVMDEEEEEGMAVMCPSSYSPARNTNATHTIPRRDQFFFSLSSSSSSSSLWKTSACHSLTVLYIRVSKSSRWTCTMCKRNIEQKIFHFFAFHRNTACCIWTRRTSILKTHERARKLNM